MQTRRLGNSDLDITPIGFGAWAIGGAGWAFGWGPQDDDDSIAAVREALATGVNWIDTAAVYGLGHSEEVVARALDGVAAADRPYIFTKCARVWDEKGAIGKRLTADSVRRECEASLRRLKVETIDLYQVHWPEPDEEIEEGWTTLARLRDEGKVRWIGVSNFDARQMERARAIAPITSLQPPYSLVNRKVEAEILPYAARHGIGVLAYSPMASGLLTGAMTATRVERLPADDWRRRNPNYQEPLLTRNLALVEHLRTIGGRRGLPTGAIAVAWVLHNPAVTAAIVGARRPGQIREIVAAADIRLTPEEGDGIEAFLRAHPA
jgi:aryl-alcohol dehydrogenase-like predicted oxidoreductase